MSMRKWPGRVLLTVLAGLVWISGVTGGWAEADALSALPEMYREEAEDVIETVDFCRGTKPMLTLLVYTDLHYDPESNEPSPMDDMFACMEALIPEIRPDALFNLGDLVNGDKYPLRQAILQINGIAERERALGIPFHNLLGNHDDSVQEYWPGWEDLPEEERPTKADLYAALMDAGPGEVHHPDRSTDYYVDYDAVRVICLSADGTAFLPETAAWLRSTALDTEKDVLILSHCPTRPEWGHKGDVSGGEMIEDALREFHGRGGTVLAFIHGHCHGDMIETAEDLPYTGVAVGCARFNRPFKGTEGMTYQPRSTTDKTKVLFEVILVDPQADRVRLIRFGAGESRIVEAELDRGAFPER